MKGRKESHCLLRSWDLTIIVLDFQIMSELQFEWVAVDAVKPNNSNSLGEMVSLDKLWSLNCFLCSGSSEFYSWEMWQGESISFVFVFSPSLSWELLKIGYMYRSRYNKYYSDEQSREFLAGAWLQVSILNSSSGWSQPFNMIRLVIWDWGCLSPYSKCFTSGIPFWILLAHRSISRSYLCFVGPFYRILEIVFSLFNMIRWTNNNILDQISPL